MKTTLSLNQMGETIDARNKELKELEALERQIAERKGAIVAANERAAANPIEDMACALHKALCTANHTDGCGWYYEIDRKGVHQWGQDAHRKYLQKANKVVAAAQRLGVEPKNVLEIIVSIREW